MATLKQKRAIERAVENGGNVSRAMIEAGYSPATAKNPDKLTSSKAWAELMEAYLPDDLILKALREDIEAKPKNRVQELQLASKLKGKLQDGNGGNKTMIVIISGQSANRYGATTHPSTGDNSA